MIQNKIMYAHMTLFVLFLQTTKKSNFYKLYNIQQQDLTGARRIKVILDFDLAQDARKPACQQDNRIVRTMPN